jgi:hypothetical protein
MLWSAPKPPGTLSGTSPRLYGPLPPATGCLQMDPNSWHCGSQKWQFRPHMSLFIIKLCTSAARKVTQLQLTPQNTDVTVAIVNINVVMEKTLNSSWWVDSIAETLNSSLYKYFHSPSLVLPNNIAHWLVTEHKISTVDRITNTDM